MGRYYTDEKNVQILIALLKEHGINKIIASPGTTNITFVGSLQNDPFFKIYSAIDERSAAYMACGLAEECGKPVVLSCTGATASRNYMSGLTEAYYRKLPILAVTSSQDISRVGHNNAQVIDRSSIPNDIVKCSVHLPLVKDDNDIWNCEVNVNKAILELSRYGGGPAHINLTTKYNRSFKTKKLPNVRVIKRISEIKNAPPLPAGKIGIFIGSHSKMTTRQVNALEEFCQSNNAVVFCDHTSGYKGKYSVVHALSSSQRLVDTSSLCPDLSIQIGEISGDYSAGKIIGKQVWRVSEDGEIRDTFNKLQYIFQMKEEAFFEYYRSDNKNNNTYLQTWNEHLAKLRKSITNLPFSNIWIASKMHNLIPHNSTIHFSILNTLRSWNFFKLDESIDSCSNVGGFGIDGCLSSLIGASLANTDKLYFGIIGDLSFFYDMNSIGNRHIGNNLRILLVNNGTGTEFKNFNHFAYQFGNEADEFIAGKGHFANKSNELVKNYSQNLGFKYLSAFNKEEFKKVYKRFLTNERLDKPILFEVFLNSEDESNALRIIAECHPSHMS